MTTYLEPLNPEQKKAVLHLEGPMMIIAGAGSGKTRVLTYRVAHLMERGIDSFQILVLTFTNKASKEMKERIAKIVGVSQVKNIWMGTFHSVFARILRIESDKLGFPRNFTIYDTQDSVRLIGSIVKEMKLDKELYKAKDILSRISKCKNNLITAKAYQNNIELIKADTIAKRPDIGKIYAAYVKRCFKAGAMDFDDLLLRMNELLVRFPEVLAKYQDRFRYILVDEYQDTNHSQYLIVKALADRFQNICIVGDDSQSIYGFRGANIQNILNFQKDYPNAKTFKLEQNYRSCNNIVQAANSVIAKNRNKLDKTIWTANESGDTIKIMRNISDREEGFWIASSIFENKMNKRLKNNAFCILYRTNSQSRAIEEALRKKGLSYKIYGGTSFYQRKEIKDILSYLRLIVNSKDDEALLRVINYPARGIGQTTLDKLVIAANESNLSIYEFMQNIVHSNISINNPTKVKLQNFVTMIERFKVEAQTKNAFEITDRVIKRTEIIKLLSKDDTPENLNRIENIQELLNGVQFFIQENAEQDASLALFLEEVSLQTSLDEDKNIEDRISLMTVHLSKGLEYPYIYLVGLEEDLFPSARSYVDRESLEEERRLFYVALTRAKKQVYLSYAQSRYRWGRLSDCEPSRFLSELDEQYVERINPKASQNVHVRPIDKNSFEYEIPKNKIRYRKPINRVEENKRLNANFKKVSEINSKKTNLFDNKLTLGNVVLHERFGQGKILKLEGKGNDSKAVIQFGNKGVKNILLRFAKLKIIS